MNWLLNAFAIIALVLLALAGIFIFSAAASAIWQSIHKQELLRLRRFRDDVIFEAVVNESGISQEVVERIAQLHQVERS